MAKNRTDTSIIIAGKDIAAASRTRIEIPVARLPTQGQVPITLEVIRGTRPGPTLWLSAAVHGDEINGVEIIRQLLGQIAPEHLSGTLIACPVLNIYGFLNQSRYLPDRRDLNRSFPGSARGSLAARIAHIFMTEVVSKSNYGIDFHTASVFNDNLPQIRTNLHDPRCLAMAEAFHAPAMLHAGLRDGSLRSAACRLNVPMLLFEGGEANRFNGTAIDCGVAGTLRVMASLGMMARQDENLPPPPEPVLASRWLRAPSSGILKLDCEPGDRIDRKQKLGIVTDAFGEGRRPVIAPFEGIVLGLRRNPLVYKGDGVIHVGAYEVETIRDVDARHSDQKGF